MSLELCLYPDPVLESSCRKVKDPTSHEELITHMRKIMYDRDGVGLAAPQVGETLALFILRTDFEERKDEVFMNPKIHSVRDREILEEGCLSFPNIRVDIERGTRVEFQAITPQGEKVERTMTGIQAQCVQHEMDHLQGETLVDRCDLSQKMAINDDLQLLKEGGIPDPPDEEPLRPSPGDSTDN